MDRDSDDDDDEEDDTDVSAVSGDSGTGKRSDSRLESCTSCGSFRGGDDGDDVRRSVPAASAAASRRRSRRRTAGLGDWDGVGADGDGDAFPPGMTGAGSSSSFPARRLGGLDFADLDDLRPSAFLFLPTSGP